MAIPVLDVYSFCYQDTGIVLNPDRISLPFVDIDQVEGLDMPEFKVEEHDKASTHGTYINAPYLKERTIVLSGTAYAANPVSLQDYLERLRLNYRPQADALPFYWRVPVSPPRDYRKTFGYSLGMNYDIDDAIGRSAVEVTISIECGDPREYLGEFVPITGSKVSGSPTTVSVPANGTMDYPGTIVANVPAGATITTPRFVNSLGGILSFAGPFTNGTLTIDLGARRTTWTTAGGVVTSLRPIWTTDSFWWLFTADTLCTVTFSSVSHSGSAIPFTVTPWPAWW